jgi:hypothetical protein
MAVRAPMTSCEISELLVSGPGIETDQKALSTARRQVGDCIKVCVNQGLIEYTGQTADHGANGPYKLWRLKRGG